MSLKKIESKLYQFLVRERFQQEMVKSMFPGFIERLIDSMYIVLSIMCVYGVLVAWIVSSFFGRIDVVDVIGVTFTTLAVNRFVFGTRKSQNIIRSLFVVCVGVCVYAYLHGV